MPDDSRRFTRVPTGLSLHVTAGPDTRSGTCRDVSMTGVFYVGPAPFPAGTPVTVAIPVGQGHIAAEGHVVRATADGMAIEFTALNDPDSYQHLHHLVLFNSPSGATADQVEDEITRSFGIRRPPEPPT